MFNTIIFIIFFFISANDIRISTRSKSEPRRTFGALCEWKYLLAE